MPARSVALRATLVATLVAVIILGAPGSALAAGPHPVPADASVIGDIFGGLGHAVLGAFTWTVKLASTFILDTLGALVKLLIPRSWAHKGAQIMAWLVAVPDYAGKVTTPGGARRYGFAGVNNLRDLFMWLGIAIAPLTLTHATARSMIGDAESDPIGIPVLRVILVAALIISYPYWWAQGAAVVDQVTHMILSLPSVTDGLQKLMDYAVDGIALGGWQLIDLTLMGAIGVALLGLIFFKVVLILLGALLYATGPLMIGLVPTRFGHTLARAWLSAVLFLLAVGVGWATIFAVGALLIEDSGTAGPLIAGHSDFGQLIGGLILAVTGLVALWLCLKVAREAGSLLRMQLGGMLALGSMRGHSSSSSGAPAVARMQTTGASMRRFAGRLAAGAGAAGGELAAAVPGGAQARMALEGAGRASRRGLIGSAAAGSRSLAGRAATPAAAIIGRSRAGAVAVNMAKAGTAGYGQRGAPSSTAPANGTTEASPEATAVGADGGAAIGASAATRASAANGSPASTGRRPRKPRGASAAANRGERTDGSTNGATGTAGNAGAQRTGPADAPRGPSAPRPVGVARPPSDRGRPVSSARDRAVSSGRSGDVAGPRIAQRSERQAPATADGKAAGEAGGTPPGARNERGLRPSSPAPARSAPARSTPPQGPAKRPTQTGKPAQKSVPARKSEEPEPQRVNTTKAPPPPASKPRAPHPPPPTSDGSRR